MNIQLLKNTLKRRKALVISIMFHVMIIVCVIIFISVFKGKKKKLEPIQEIELFTPPEQNVKQLEEQPNSEPIKKEETKDEPVAEHKKQMKRKRPAPEPFKTKLKDNVIKQWDTIEKKNLQNQ
ncbi:hypothetical protein J7L67_09340 [bacterium]|nr:hypothetical protein [bacterium]